jgi:hypothetical protein
MTHGWAIHINLRPVILKRICIRDQQVVAPFGFLRYIQDTGLMMLLHVQLNFFFRYQNGRFEPGDNDLVTHVGLRCGPNPHIQALRSLLLKGSSHVVKRTVYLE